MGVEGKPISRLMHPSAFDAGGALLCVRVWSSNRAKTAFRTCCLSSVSDATGRWAADYAINCNLATAYFELLANAHGLGTVIMSYPSDVICELAPVAREMLGIPSDHYMKLLVGFGYPEISYARGTQKNHRKVHRWTERSKGQLSLL